MLGWGRFRKGRRVMSYWSVSVVTRDMQILGLFLSFRLPRDLARNFSGCVTCFVFHSPGWVSAHKHNIGRQFYSPFCSHSSRIAVFASFIVISLNFESSPWLRNDEPWLVYLLEWLICDLHNQTIALLLTLGSLVNLTANIRAKDSKVSLSIIKLLTLESIEKSSLLLREVLICNKHSIVWNVTLMNWKEWCHCSKQDLDERNNVR